MTLSAGARLGPYEILSPLGAGGMGEIYKARDTRLGRDVAIKVLPAGLSSDPERLKRFEKEARSASALNHPNLVTIYDIGESGGTSFIAMELVDGSTLRDLLAGGALPTKRALAIAAQVADGLAKAHAAGIVHRDLKPENVMVSGDGHAKVLDFGLAKLGKPEAKGAEPTRAPTRSRGTEPGVVLGTVAYMSPEQASGQPLDFQSDQFSFGSVLYEMVTGRRAFSGKTEPETMAAVIREEPEPVASLAPKAPAPLRWIIERCLAKDPRDRYASTVDLAKDLVRVREHVSEVSGPGAAPARSLGTLRRGFLAWALAAAALLLGFAGGLLIRGRGRSTEQPQPLMRLNLTVPPAESPVATTVPPMPVLALSPDGARLVYVGISPGGTRLYVRPMDRSSAEPIAGTEGALGPFFSPDGQWVGFWADKELKKVSVAGGSPLVLCDAPALRGASWGPDGNILFAPAPNTGLFRVSEKGGAAKQVTTLDAKKGDMTHRWPQVLPGGRAVVFTSHDVSGNYDKARIELVLLETGERRTLIEGGTDARYLPTGHLVYLRAGSLFAVPFDLNRLAVTGPSVPVLDGVGSEPEIGCGHFGFSSSGNLVYLAEDPRRFEGELVRIDRKGVTRSLTDSRRAYLDVHVSPDGRFLAVSAGHPDPDIWIYDLERSSWDRLTTGSRNVAPVWSPDGRRIAFSSNRNGSFNPFWMPIDRSQPAEQIFKDDQWVFPTSFSPDGRALLLITQTVGTSLDVSVVFPDSADRNPRPLVQSPASEHEGKFSPDGRWIAYVSNESGRQEVYVTAFPGARGRWQVSTHGGEEPVWSRDGKELFYRSSAGKLMAVAIETKPQWRAGVPRPLFELKDIAAFDVFPDGREFVGIRTTGRDLGPPEVVAVVGWFDEVKRRVAAQRQLP